ncbi:hypothetical protein D9M71_404050 [compost metagenome]
MQYRVRQHAFAQALGQGLQGDRATPHPLGQVGARQRYPVAGRDLLQTIQRQMVEAFAGQDPAQQARRGHAAVDDRRRQGGGADRLAVAAAVLRADVAMDEEARRLYVQLLGDVLADQLQGTATFRAGAGRRLVAVLDTRQVRRQRLTAGARAASLGSGGQDVFDLLELGLDSRLVDGLAFLEQIALRGGQGFALDAELEALVMGQLQGQGLDLQFGITQLLVAGRQFCRLLLALGQQLRHRLQQRGVGGVAAKFGEQIHGRHLTRATG